MHCSCSGVQSGGLVAHGTPGALAFRWSCAAEDADFVATTDAELEDEYAAYVLPCPPLNGTDARNVTLAAAYLSRAWDEGKYLFSLNISKPDGRSAVATQLIELSDADPPGVQIAAVEPKYNPIDGTYLPLYGEAICSAGAPFGPTPALQNGTR